ncbi:MAG TPA: DUF6807 family protein [Tepidisphaeraceae bacterium]|nr:DUF6807 family protein [Tepidisphaeraceae bacterium]
MQIPRAFATFTILMAMGLVVPLAEAKTTRLKLKIENLPSSGMATPVSVALPADQIPANASLATLTINGLSYAPLVQIVGTNAYWIMPAVKSASIDAELTFDSDTSIRNETFKFVDGDGFRDLVYGDQKITRDMIKWDPSDRANTFKPFTHVFAFNGDGYITKGPGGLYTHHRGIFFGFKTQYGDFWHCPDVHQEHEKYLTSDEFAGPIAAREIATTLWKDKEGKPVARDTRDVKTWHIAPNQLVLDYDITVESLNGSIDLGGDPHHAGFHFRADNEVAGADQKAGKTGTAKYLRPPGATSRPNDFWDNEPWVACLFTVKNQPYIVMHMDHPTNPRPIVYSTRSYGRFGSFFTGKVEEGKPLHLKYRLLITDGSGGFQSVDHYAALYHDFISPVNVTISKN